FADTWYGINGNDQSGVGNSGFPFTTAPPPIYNPGASVKRPRDYFKLSQIRDAGAMVAFFDGLYMNFRPGTSDPEGNFYARIAARHRSRTATNICFMDGRAETFDRRELPYKRDG